MQSSRFKIEAKPVPTPRPRVSRNGGVFFPKTYTAYRGTLDKFFETLGEPKMITGPVEIRILSVMPRYATSDYPTYRADVDNLAKGVMDAMTKHGFWTDDNLVVVLNTSKRFCHQGEEPHTQVRIIELEGTVEDHVDLFFGA